ncbi:hypothetical protein LAA29_140121 [Leuconostoc carnosum]|nr:hypothetical protein LCAC16_240121 [Leuconostoc carnosum]SPO33714.1 hypothetical protein LAA29_140121 [Leuconostoc carnosum]
MTGFKINILYSHSFKIEIVLITISHTLRFSGVLLFKLICEISNNIHPIIKNAKASS